MSKKINYKLEKLDFFSDFNDILYTNTRKLLKGYFYSRIVVYNKADYKKLNVLNKCNFLFNMKLQTALMNEITVHFLLKKYYDKIFTNVLHDAHKIHPSKGANITNILEMLNSSVHRQRGGGMRIDIIKFILLIGLFFSFFSPISSSSVPALPGKEDTSKQYLPEAFTKSRRDEEMNREKKKQHYGKYFGKGSAVVSGILTALLLPALKELTEEQVKELLDNIVLELNTETNNVYKLVSDHCDSFVTTLHENGILDSSSITEMVPEDFEKDKEKGAFVEKKANETTSSSMYDYFFAPSKPAEPKPAESNPNSTVPARKTEYDELVEDVIDESNEDDTVNVNNTGTSLVFTGKNASKTASRFERYIEHAAEKFNDKDKLTIKYKFLCNSAFKSNIIIGQSDGMYLIRQLNGHITLVSENLSMMEQLKSFLLNMKSNAEKKITASVLYLPNPIYKQIIQKIEIFELIMSNSLISYFPFSDMQTFNQSVSKIRDINKRVSVEAQWLNYENPMDKRTTQMKFNAEQEKQLFEANMRLQEAELRSEIETQQANQIIKENLERAQRIEETTNSTQVYNKAKKREWGEFFDSNFGKDNILSQFVSTTINGGLFEGILGPLLENVKKYGYEILTFVLVGAGVVLFVYSVPSISFAIGRRLKRETPAIQPAAAAQGQGQTQAQPENASTIVLARLPNENQVLQIKYDETGTPLEFDVVIINQHLRGDIKTQLFNLLNYYKQDRNKIILFTIDDNILCGKFISIKSNKILIDTVNGTRTVDYDDIIDPIITPYLNTEHIREKYIQCLSLFTAKQPSLPLTTEDIIEFNKRLLTKPSHRRRSHSRRSRRRSHSSSSESSRSSRSPRSRRTHSRRSRPRSPIESMIDVINEPPFVTV
jgi:hypothetical protein